MSQFNNVMYRGFLNSLNENPQTGRGRVEGVGGCGGRGGGLCVCVCACVRGGGVKAVFKECKKAFQ